MVTSTAKHDRSSASAPTTKSPPKPTPKPTPKRPSTRADIAALVEAVLESPNCQPGLPLWVDLVRAVRDELGCDIADAMRHAEQALADLCMPPKGDQRAAALLAERHDVRGRLNPRNH